MAKLKEFIQIEGIYEIQDEIRQLNYKLLNAMNQTNIVRELVTEKNNLMMRARDASSLLIPEVRALNAFMGGESDEFDTIDPLPSPRLTQVRPKKHAAKPVAKRGRGRPRKMPEHMLENMPKLPKAIKMPKMPKELELNLPKELRPVKAKRGRPRKTAKKEIEVAARLNPLDELRRNLAKLRDE